MKKFIENNITTKEEKVLRFFKEAFCINGKAKIIDEKKYNNFKIKAIIELNDLIKGQFYIGLLKKE